MKHGLRRIVDGWLFRIALTRFRVSFYSLPTLRLPSRPPFSKLNPQPLKHITNSGAQIERDVETGLVQPVHRMLIQGAGLVLPMH